MATISKYIFRVDGEVKSTQTYNGDGGSDYRPYATPPSGFDRDGFILNWDFDYINSITTYDTDNIITKIYYYDAVYFYNNPNYVTCNFLYSDNGQFATVKAVNGNVTSNFVGVGAYYKNSIVSVTVSPRPYYSLTGEINPQYSSTWTTNTVYRCGTVEGARITWKNYDDRTIRIDYVKEGETPTPPNVRRTGYTLTGWSPTIVPVHADATYTAQYTINRYHIRFLDEGGIYLDTYMDYGTPLNISMEMTKEDYEFRGWNPNPTYVMQDQDYWAIWEKVRFTINYYDGQTLINTVKVDKGNELPSYIPTKQGYRFNAWNPSIQSPVYADANYTATWNPLYTVAFLDTDDSVISSNQYIIGEKIQIPTPPTKPHYLFLNWTPLVKEICDGNATYQAVYGEYSTTLVRFYDGKGNIYSEQSINIEGEYVQMDLSLKELVQIGVVIPNDPTISGRVFIKWIKYPTKYDEPNKTIIYTFKPKFISASLENGYYNTRLDDVEGDISEHVNNMNLHIVDQTKVIDDSNSTVNGLHNIDGDIIDEIKYIKNTNIKNKELLDNIDKQKFDEQFSDVYEEVGRVQDEITDMDINHKEDLYNIGNQILENETKLNNIQNKIYNIPKHVVLSDFDYKNMGTPDKNTIYFTRETN